MTMNNSIRFGAITMAEFKKGTPYKVEGQYGLCPGAKVFVPSQCLTSKTGGPQPEWKDNGWVTTGNSHCYIVKGHYYDEDGNRVNPLEAAEDRAKIRLDFYRQTADTPLTASALSPLDIPWRKKTLRNAFRIPLAYFKDLLFPPYDPENSIF